MVHAVALNTCTGIQPYAVSTGKRKETCHHREVWNAWHTLSLAFWERKFLGEKGVVILQPEKNGTEETPLQR
jgi:hypothetical protein